jgi:soluble lytic murein transglycosylase
MHWHKILTPLLAATLWTTASPLVAAQIRGDDALLAMQQAYRKGDRNQLAQLLPAVRGHGLEPWGAYWELRLRLDTAQPDEVQSFLKRWAGTYHEDRLRNDWLLLLGQRRDWAQFAQLLPGYRMQDDRAVRCYALTIEQIEGRAGEAQAQEVRDLWHAQRDSEDGCTNAAGNFYNAKLLSDDAVWRKARLAADANRQRAVRDAVQLVAPESLPLVNELFASPIKFLTGPRQARGQVRKELGLLALIRLAANDPGQAAAQLEGRWNGVLSAEERNWAWAAIGKQAAFKLQPEAQTYFANVRKDQDLNDELLGWKVRTALRASQWRSVTRAIDAMSPQGQADSAWVYWKARALIAPHGGDAERAQARQLFERIAGSGGFYEQLALEELGQRVTVPAAPAPLTPQEKAAALANPGLQRGLQAIQLGLRSEGVREWNYATNLHTPGGMDERSLLAAANLACQREIWDRCINTSERTRSEVNWNQRYPMPFHDTVIARSRMIGLDPAYVYGLIRQESRFIMDARSGVGASGLMQVMPATARWTARKIGMSDFTPGMINDREVNITIGTAYLKLALDDFDGSMAMAAAGYNAGPGRPRVWRNGPVLDAAIWAENVPFTETRDYVKKVLANTTAYAALITGQPQSLKARLGTVGPRPTNEPEPIKDLP